MSDIKAFHDDWEAGHRYQQDVQAALEAVGGDCTSPEWFEWCQQMDEWNAAQIKS